MWGLNGEVTDNVFPFVSSLLSLSLLHCLLPVQTTKPQLLPEVHLDMKEFCKSEGDMPT